MGSSASSDPVLSELYQSMFKAKQAGDHAAAETFMQAIEKQRTSNGTRIDSQLIVAQLPLLPVFARQVLGKSQTEVGRTERSNCINAAFNYHDSDPHWETYSTTDFLNRVQTDYSQIQPSDGVRRGDLVVLWSRTGGSWDDRTIDVHQIDRSAPDFPYGLVFDHVAVCLGNDLVFHKPDPTPESRYQIETFDDVKAVTSGQRGFELTFHRRKPSGQ